MKIIFADIDNGFIEFDDEIFMLQTELKKLRAYTYSQSVKQKANKQATPKYLLVLNELGKKVYWLI